MARPVRSSGTQDIVYPKTVFLLSFSGEDFLDIASSAHSHHLLTHHLTPRLGPLPQLPLMKRAGDRILTHIPGYLGIPAPSTGAVLGNFADKVGGWSLWRKAQPGSTSPVFFSKSFIYFLASSFPLCKSGDNNGFAGILMGKGACRGLNTTPFRMVVLG